MKEKNKFNQYNYLYIATQKKISEKKTVIYFMKNKSVILTVLVVLVLKKQITIVRFELKETYETRHVYISS